MAERGQINGVRSGGGGLYLIAILAIVGMFIADATGIFKAAHPVQPVTKVTNP